MNNPITIPVGIDFITWSRQIQRDLPQLIINLASTEEEWHPWANQLISVNELWNVPLATKQVFPLTEDWRKWARYFVETSEFM